MGDHDAFFKLVFEHPARAAGELRSVLPASVAAALDLDALAHVPGSFVDAELADRHADLLFRAPLRTTASDPDQGASPEDEAAYVFFLLEHQSEPDPLMPFRVLVYMVRIWERHLRDRKDEVSKRLPPIVPLVVHHGEQGWTSPRHLHQLMPMLRSVPSLRRYVPRFRLLVDDLVTRSDDVLLARPLDTLARLALWALRDARRRQRLEAHLERWLELLIRLTRRSAADGEIYFLMRYLSKVISPERASAIGARIVAAAPGTEHAMITHEQFLEQRGRQVAKRELSFKLMTKRFGTLPPRVAERLEAATEAELDTYLERLLESATADDVVR